MTNIHVFENTTKRIEKDISVLQEVLARNEHSATLEKELVALCNQRIADLRTIYSAHNLHDPQLIDI